MALQAVHMGATVVHLYYILLLTMRKRPPKVNCTVLRDYETLSTRFGPERQAMRRDTVKKFAEKVTMLEWHY